MRRGSKVHRSSLRRPQKPPITGFMALARSQEACQGTESGLTQRRKKGHARERENGGDNQRENL
jgi:hypothetical protein